MPKWEQFRKQFRKGLFFFKKPEIFPPSIRSCHIDSSFRNSSWRQGCALGGTRKGSFVGSSPLRIRVVIDLWEQSLKNICGC